MAKEIERKFLVDPAKLPSLPEPNRIRQGYIPAQDITVRVRINNGQAFLTLKGKAEGLSRSEFEYPIPADDAKEILSELCIHPLIEKKRYLIPFKGHTWEVDVFEGENSGLIIAEIELKEEAETFTLPEWVTQEVSYDPKYRNSNLIISPYSEW